MTCPTPRRAVPTDAATDAAAARKHEAVSVLSSERDALIALVSLTTRLDAVRAEDVVHDVILRVLDHGVPADVANWLAYLRKAVVREGLSVLRKASREQELAERAAFDQRADSAHDDAVRALLHDALGDLDCLSDEEREVFVLVYLGGFPQDEIAEIVGLLNKGQVNRRHRSAKAKLDTRRKTRETDARYLGLLALLRQPATTARSGAVGSAATAMTAATGFAVLAVVARIAGVPLPYVRDLPRTAPFVSRPFLATAGMRGAGPEARPGHSVGPVGGIGTLTPASQGIPDQDPGGPSTTCTTPALVCVGVGKGDGGDGADDDPTDDGDTVSIYVADMVITWEQRVAPVCRRLAPLPPPERVRCTRGGSYLLAEEEGSTTPGVKKVPPASAPADAPPEGTA